MNVKALLKQVPAMAYLYGLLAAALVTGYAGFVHTQREIGKRDIQIHQYEVANADLRHEADSLRKAYKVDTLRLTKIRRVTDSLTVTVEQWKHDTLRVVEYVAQADTTIKACTKALSTCEARVGVAQRGWDGARDEIKVLKASMPSKLAPWRDRLIGVIVGGAIVAVAKP